MVEVFKMVAHIYAAKTTTNVLNFRENFKISLRGLEFTLQHNRLSIVGKNIMLINNPPPFISLSPRSGCFSFFPISFT